MDHQGENSPAEDEENDQDYASSTILSTTSMKKLQKEAKKKKKKQQQRIQKQLEDEDSDEEDDPHIDPNNNNNNSTDIKNDNKNNNNTFHNIPNASIEDLQQPSLRTSEILRAKGLTSVLHKFHLTCKRHSRHSNLCQFSYSQLHSPLPSPIVQECRGLVCYLSLWSFYQLLFFIKRRSISIISK